MKSNSTPSLQTVELTQAEKPVIAPGEIVIGSIVEINSLGEPCVNFQENTTSAPLAALSTLSITHCHIGKQVALLFANGNFNNPVIMGLIHNPLQALLDSVDQNQPPLQNDTTYITHNSELSVESELPADDLLIDGNKIVFEAQEEIVLKCGESSITLTKSGKILIRGKYLLNRSTGVNRILGGSVQIN